MSFISVYSKDYYRMTGEKLNFSGSVKAIILILFRPALKYMLYLRILQDDRICIVHPIFHIFRFLLSRKTGIEIHPSTKIGPGFRMVHARDITINSKASIGMNVNMYKGSTIGNSGGKHSGVPKIGNNVQIGINSTVIGGITIGNDVLIAPNTLVNFDVQDHSIVIGNPAKVIHRENATTDYVYFC